jgi:hypothetical protein
MYIVLFVDPHVPEGNIPMQDAFFNISINGQECVLPKGGYILGLGQFENRVFKTMFNLFADSLPMLSIIEGFIVRSIQVGIVIASGLWNVGLCGRVAIMIIRSSGGIICAVEPVS